ncbi:hypothetical protein BHM03_00026330, partial [Ensete ventricosum]
ARIHVTVQRTRTARGRKPPALTRYLRPRKEMEESSASRLRILLISHERLRRSQEDALSSPPPLKTGWSLKKGGEERRGEDKEGREMVVKKVMSFSPWAPPAPTKAKRRRKCKVTVKVVGLEGLPPIPGVAAVEVGWRRLPKVGGALSYLMGRKRPARSVSSGRPVEDGWAVRWDDDDESSRFENVCRLCDPNSVSGSAHDVSFSVLYEMSSDLFNLHHDRNYRCQRIFLLSAGFDACHLFDRIPCFLALVISLEFYFAMSTANSECPVTLSNHFESCNISVDLLLND